jgi:hypothetical protein
VSDFDLEAGLHNLLLPSSAARDNPGQGTRVNRGGRKDARKNGEGVGPSGGENGRSHVASPRLIVKLHKAALQSIIPNVLYEREKVKGKIKKFRKICKFFSDAVFRLMYRMTA